MRLKKPNRFAVVIITTYNICMGIKYSVNEDFFKNWSQEMAYVLGYIYADGSMTDASYLRGKYVSITSVERNNLAKIKNWLESEHAITQRPPTTINGKDIYTLRIGSKEIYKDLIALGLYPNKSLSIGFPEIPSSYLPHFIRGYFDGDGCAYFEKSLGSKNQIISKRLRVIFTSGSKKFLSGLLDILRGDLDLNQSKVYNGHKSFQLSFSTGDSIKIFKFLYAKAKESVFLERKYETFLSYFSFMPNRVDIRVKNVIKYVGYGHVVK